MVPGSFDGRRKPRTTARAKGPGSNGPRDRREGWRAFGIVWAGAALIGTAYGAGWMGNIWNADQMQATGTSSNSERVSFSLCHTGGGYNCVVDGDTIWLRGQKIRIADIDAPETHDYRCASEKELGDRATRHLRDLLESGPITLQPIDRNEDVYGRKLRIVLVNGESVGDALVSAGLARRYAGGRRPWC